LDGARAMTVRAAALRCAEPRARAAVQHAMAMLAAAEGDHRQAELHCSTALANAETDNDLLQQVWIRLCRSFHTLDLGAPRAALAEAQTLLRLSERCDNLFLAAHALTTCGRAKVRLGTLEEAPADFAAAIDLFQVLGSRFVAWPLCGLGDLHRMRGQVARARAAYEEALDLAEPDHDVIALSSALIGLARVRATADIAVARDLAERAVEVGEDLRQVPAYLTRGWVALVDGDREAATADAAQAAAAARARRDNPGLAEAITLTVLADPDADTALLGEAIDMWQDTGCRLEEAVGRVVAARIGAPVHHAADDLALHTLRGAGVPLRTGQVAGPLAVLARSAPSVSIRTLGSFQVSRGGIPIPTAAWPSRKARDLLKILIARRRPVHREQLMELLWPEASPAKSSNRLSVLLTMVRGILQPDQPDQPDQTQGGPLVADNAAVWLDLTRVSIDVETFLALAPRALHAHSHDDPDPIPSLEAALATHTGDFLEDDPYPEWAAPLGEEVRATHIALLQALVSRLKQAGNIDAVILYTLRLLEQDNYNEQAHFDLITALIDAGRLGEGRRRHQIYTRHMEEIHIHPRPLPPPRTRYGV
ncbi:MAG: tetratricopeptide repeat protein, partial [Sciscionella sp.]